jgi:hypothetical protein
LERKILNINGNGVCNKCHASKKMDSGQKNVIYIYDRETVRLIDLQIVITDFYKLVKMSLYATIKIKCSLQVRLKWIAG